MDRIVLKREYALRMYFLPIICALSRFFPIIPSGNTALTITGFPENDLCSFLCYFPGECNALRDVFRGFQYHAMGKGTTADAAVPLDEECMQFPCKGEASVNAGITGLFTPENHPKRHHAPGNRATGTARTPDTYGKP